MFEKDDVHYPNNHDSEVRKWTENKSVAYFISSQQAGKLIWNTNNNVTKL